MKRRWIAAAFVFLVAVMCIVYVSGRIAFEQQQKQRQVESDAENERINNLLKESRGLNEKLRKLQ